MPSFRTAALRRRLRWLRATPLHPQWLMNRAARVGDLIAAPLSGAVLDVGAGAEGARNHVGSDAQYYALDYPTTALQLYRTQPDVFADGARLPFPDHTFDTVFVLEVLEHMEHPDAAIREAFRVLRDGGTLYCSTPFLYPLHDEPHDFQRLTVHRLRKVLTATGFTVRTLRPSLGAIETGGLLLCLALAGSLLDGTRRRPVTVLLAPVVLGAIACINLLAWLIARLLPDWPAMSTGNQAVAVKPGAVAGLTGSPAVGPVAGT